MTANNNNSNNSLVDEFENAFQSCLSALTNPSTVHIHDSDEVKTSVEQTIQRFLDIGRQIECFFLQKRLLLSDQKPELILSEDCSELKNEIARKDQILTKYYDKLQLWQSMINETVANSDGSHHLQRQTSLNQSMTAPQTPMSGQPSQSQPPLRHAVQSPVAAGNGPHLMRPSMGPQMSGPMTPPQMISSGPMPGPVGMLPPPPPQTGMASGQPTNMGPMMGQMPTQQTGQPMGQQFMPQQSHPVGLQGPLAYLERTTSNIGLPDPRR
ncbi:unnamed protein product [Oppiella nova]|uniref:Mediator of RNA polymerase II transcription subunit 28 n=1 Tax=Oppiella nova TaxID=334625 RepID=A0A7R9LBU0_9ACAR|nr:unnamed protein product [Oppiella nova]CAG2162001.1 unnamed protein product [Oppiella nova]